jgi:hypothetical protein
MFRWYQNADKCYVYLPDVSTSKEGIDLRLSPAMWEAAFRTSRWFSRGWTLQELINVDHCQGGLAKNTESWGFTAPILGRTAYKPLIRVAQG